MAFKKRKANGSYRFKKYWNKWRVVLRQLLKDKLIMRALQLLILLLEVVKNYRGLHH